MAVVWVLERPRPLQANLPDLLQGDFAVRVFASVRSFLRLARQNVRRPNLVLVRSEDFGDEIENLDQILLLQWEDVLRVYWGDVPGNLGTGAWVLASERWQDLPFLLQQVLNSQPGMQASAAFLQLGDICLDTDAQRVRILPGGTWNRVAPKEMLLLKVFMKNPQRCLSHEDLVEAVWRDVKVSPRSLASHVSRLRRSLASSSYEIRNVYGGGYQLHPHGGEDVGR